MKKNIYPFFILFICSVFTLTRGEEKTYTLSSPDNHLKVIVSLDETVNYSVLLDDEIILSPSPISIELIDDGILGENPVLADSKTTSVDEIITSVVPVKSREIADIYNELLLIFEDNYSVRFRAYNDGIAYRIETDLSDQIKVKNENVVYNFPADHKIYFPEEESFISHYERLYQHINLSEISDTQFCSLPALVDVENGPKILISESDVEDYPQMFLKGSSSNSLSGLFPGVVLEAVPAESGPDRNEVIAKTADYIADTKGERTFPWRVMIIAKEDKDLVESELVYKLAKPLQLDDVSWIKPGKIAWDWWNANNIIHVDFRAGINTETYKYYIDFASSHNIEYVVLDEGWSESDNVLKPSPGIDIEELCSYAKSKNVGIILWVLWKPFDRVLDEALNWYSELGAVGVKVDFMQRADQWMTNYYKRVAEKAAEHHMLVDYHGAYKPDGLRRAYPNVMTREGVQGMEHCKWSETETPEHNVTLPFTRMVAGPMDYTPGAMRNANKENFRIIFTRPMSIGTRCHQLAMYVVYESPLQMLADNPSNYLKEEKCMEFLSAVPTVWDETVVIDGKIREYILVARKNNGKWYIGGMTNSSPRELEFATDFLDDGDYTMSVYRDGINADRNAEDFWFEKNKISKGEKIKIKMAAGGGWIAVLTKD